VEINQLKSFEPKMRGRKLISVNWCGTLRHNKAVKNGCKIRPWRTREKEILKFNLLARLEVAWHFDQVVLTGLHHLKEYPADHLIQMLMGGIIPVVSYTG
jgi:hypothetical protein